MKAIFFRQHGDAGVLEYGELPEPKLLSNSVLVRVKAVALNHLDIFVRKGWPGLSLEFPHVPGSDVAGEVDRVGSEVSDLKVGEHVRGGYAELVAVPRQNILPKPSNLSFEQAACVPLTFLTAWTMLVRKAQVKPGETVLVHAAGSGVGSAGIQIAKLLGATVITTASTQEKLNRGKELGADYLINYAQTDFLKEVKKITQRRMVQVVFEHVCTHTFEKSLVRRPYGCRLVTDGATTGYEAKLDLRVLFYKQISLLGSTMGSKGDLFRILELVQQGRLRPVLDRVLPLQKAAEAQRQLESRAHFGNVVLVPS